MREKMVLMKSLNARIIELKQVINGLIDDKLLRAAKEAEQDLDALLEERGCFNEPE